MSARLLLVALLATACGDDDDGPCVDADGDGAGEGCGASDCDDSDPAVTDECGTDCEANPARKGCPCAAAEPAPCYHGPEGSADVGACASGEQSCEDGVLGECVGQVLPAPETCNLEDDDCNGLDDDGIDPTCAPEWRGVYESLEEGWLVSAWANAQDDIWFVGGTWDQPLVVHFDGTRFESVDIDGDALLWWAWGSAEGDLWAVGEKGSIFQRDAGGFVRVASPAEDATYYGIWGEDADDLWAVGNVPVEGGTPTGLIVRSRDAGPFEVVEVEGDPIPGLFKVWGSSADDVFFVGESGTMLHWDGTDLVRVDAGTTVRLFTVHGCSADDVYAVGGFGNGVVLEQQGSGGAWTDISPPFAPLINGVHCSAGGEGVTVTVVGMQGYVATRTEDGGWQEALPTDLDLHGIWGDGPDYGFAVGGNLLAAGRDRPQRGVLVHLGQDLAASPL